MNNADLFLGFPAVIRFDKLMLPMRYANKVRRARRLLGVEAQQLQGLRDDLLKRYAKMNGEGKAMTNKDGAVIFADPEGAQAELNELMGQSVDVDIVAVPMSELNEELEITGEDIEWLVKCGVLVEEETPAHRQEDAPAE